MGGDHLHCYASEDESSTLDNDDDAYSETSSYPSSFYRDGLKMRDEDESASGSFVSDYKGFDEVGRRVHSNPVEFDGNLRRRKIAYNEIMRNYDELWARRECLYQAKSKILSYTPGAWISNVGDKKEQNHAIPKTTTLLLIGPKGCGKSSLVNRISRVLEDDKFSTERAQVTYNSSAGDGTFFLQEYMVPRGSASFCLFDTRSLSEDFVDNDEMLQHWMTKGVRHGELVIRDSDSPSLKLSLECKAQQSGTPSSEIRKVNFVVFVVNGLSVLKAMNSYRKEDRRYMEMVTKTFSCPYLSYKDDKPVIVVTHGDLLSLGDRARVRVYLGEKLGVPPAKQIFDIPDNSDPLTELTILDMIRYSLEHADKHMPCRESSEWVIRSTFPVYRIKDKVSGTSILTLMFMAILLGITCVALPVHRSHKHNDSLKESGVSWSSRAQTNYPSEPHERRMIFPSNSEANAGSNYLENRGYHIPEPQVGPSQNPASNSAVHNQRFMNRDPLSPSVATSQFVIKDKKIEDSEAEHATFPSYSEADAGVSYFENRGNHIQEPQVTPSQTLPSKSSVNNQRIVNGNPQTTSAATSQFVMEDKEDETSEAEPVATSSLSFPQEVTENQEQEIFEEEEEEDTSISDFLPKSTGTKSQSSQPVVTPTPRSRSARKPRHRTQSPSPEKRHPKSAVKWHKIRHLWLDE